MKDKALEYIEKLCLVYENSNSKDIKNAQETISQIYRFSHCVQEKRSCYHVHENWRKELAEQNWEI